MPSLVPYEAVDYLVIGHLAHDLTPQGPRLGGTASYSALTARALGLRVGVVSPWGNEIPLDKLHGIQVQKVAAEHSTTFENIYTLSGLIQHLHHVAPDLKLEDIPEAWRRAPIVQIGPIAQEAKLLVSAGLSSSLLGLTPQGWLRMWDGWPRRCLSPGTGARAMKGLFKGLATTFSTGVRKPVTVQYPEEKRSLPARQRSFPVLLWDFDHDEPVCTGCNVCVRNCPVDCMTAVMKDNPKYTDGTSDRRKIVDKFWIDYARCMRCNICVEVCPFEAIVMDNTWAGHEQSVFDRRDLHKDIDELMRASREGRLVRPWRPEDSVALNAVQVTGEGKVEPTFTVSLPEARQRMLDRIAQVAPLSRRCPPIQNRRWWAAPGR